METITEEKELDCYHNGNDDQPTTCPYCQNRTEFIEITDTKQLHECSCGYKFYKYFDNDTKKERKVSWQI